jgi:hypothetical protein
LLPEVKLTQVGASGQNPGGWLIRFNIQL